MGKGKKNPKASTEKSKVAKFPKQVCCESRTKCGRCPLRMLKEGTLPAGYTVRRRRLVKLESVELMHHEAPVLVATKAPEVTALACHTTRKKIKSKGKKKAKKAA